MASIKHIFPVLLFRLQAGDGINALFSNSGLRWKHYFYATSRMSAPIKGTGNDFFFLIKTSPLAD
jgi:hypothetical protein